MKKHITKTNLFIVLLTILTTSLNAQSWQWLKAGGNNDSGSGSDYYSEKIKHMESDPAGNVYVAFKQVIDNDSPVPTPFTISSYQVPHYSKSDAILASFSCDGTLRWTVALGGVYSPPTINGPSNTNGAQILDLKTDSSGNVYVTGLLIRSSNPLNPIYFSPTFTIPNSAALNENKENFFIAKYNTNGIVQWVRFPEASDVVYNNNDRRAIARSMDVDPNGTIHLDSLLAPGTFCNGALTITGNLGTYYRRILKYDTNGIYIGNVAIEYIDETYFYYHFLHDASNDRYYVAKYLFYPEVIPIIGGQSQISSVFVAAFNANGTLLWKKEDNSSSTSIIGYNPSYHGLSLDGTGNIYFNCTLGALVNPITVEFTGEISSWDGQQLVIPENWNMEPLATVIKMDPNGNTIWIKNNTEPTAVPILHRSIINGDELAIATGTKSLQWEGIDYVEHPVVNGATPAILRLNKNTGIGISIDFLDIGFGNEFPASSIAAGVNGSYYLGGGFSQTITAPGLPSTVSTGGIDDFFIAKFGASNCTLATVTTTPNENIQTYPNPVTTLLHINNKEIINYIIYDALGKMVQMDTLEPNGSIDLQYLTKGIYLLQMKDESGTITTEKIMKN